MGWIEDEIRRLDRLLAAARAEREADERWLADVRRRYGLGPLDAKS